MTKKPSEELKKLFPFSPTNGQLAFFDQMDVFLTPNQKTEIPLVYLLKGYAGTGKTSLISSLIKVLHLYKYKFILLAPTGRAAKVMAFYSGKRAHTIHRKIYRNVTDTQTGVMQFKRQENNNKNTLFIVDEASMISDDAEYGTSGLLTDLMEYVFSSDENGKDLENRLLLVGDKAQLPPVGKDESPALSESYLHSQFHVELLSYELTEVMRQEKKSGILENATHIRDSLQKSEDTFLQFKTKKFTDFFRMYSDRLEDGIQYAYRKFGLEHTTVICRTNKTTVQYNRFIRQRILGYEEELCVGDWLMVVRNNYFFLPEGSPAGFLANGDFVEVIKIRGVEDRYGFRFADVILRLTDYSDENEFEAKILISTLYSENASLSTVQNRELYDKIHEEYSNIVNRRVRMEEIRKNPYLNAIQVKFAYALTCHKTQGGQWKVVFIDQGFINEDQARSQDFIRWAYTAVTRATDQVFLVNFHAKFFGESEEN